MQGNCSWKPLASARPGSGIRSQRFPLAGGSLLPPAVARGRAGAEGASARRRSGEKASRVLGAAVWVLLLALNPRFSQAWQNLSPSLLLSIGDVGVGEMHAGLALVGSLAELEGVKEENTDFSLQFLPYSTEYVRG